ncbi:MAG TPA: CPBP family intramembrane glutamic endopeptidase [Microlunatus sp.]
MHVSERVGGVAVRWARVGLFYGIALGGAVIVALVIWVLRRTIGDAAVLVGTAVTALLYMPLPMVAGLIVERVAGRRPLIVAEWRSLRTGFWRTYGRNAVTAVVLIMAILVLAAAVAWSSGVLGIPGAGHLVTSDAELNERLSQVSGGLALGTAALSVGAVAATGIVQGIAAGLTINGLFAFGEEYGWRGVLADELRPLGRFRAPLLTGVLWGLWHAPIIMLGHNYGSEWRWGVFVMVAWTVPFSFVLTWARERTGSVLAPAMLHGAANGALGMFVYLVIGGNALIALPVGLLMAITLTVLAIVIWHLPRPAGGTPSRRGFSDAR